MRTVYCESWGRKVAAVDDRYVLSDRVKTGHVLHVLTCFAGAPEREANDVIAIGIRSGGKDICLRHRAGSLAKNGMSTLNEFLVGEGDQILAYFPDSDTGDEIYLCVNGFLVPANEWRAIS